MKIAAAEFNAKAEWLEAAAHPRSVQIVSITPQLAAWPRSRIHFSAIPPIG